MSQHQADAGGLAVPERPRPHPDIETAFLAPEALLYDSSSGTVIHLNGSAAAIWMTLDGRLDVSGITSELSEVFGLPADTMRPDIETALTDFARRKLLVDGQ